MTATPQTGSESEFLGHLMRGADLLRAGQLEEGVRRSRLNAVGARFALAVGAEVWLLAGSRVVWSVGSTTS